LLDRAFPRCLFCANNILFYGWKNNNGRNEKMKRHKMWIGGKWVNAESGKTYTVINPATKEEVAQEIIHSYN